MAKKRIKDLSYNTNLRGSDFLVTDSSEGTEKVTVDDLKNYIQEEAIELEEGKGILIKEDVVSVDLSNFVDTSILLNSTSGNTTVQSSNITSISGQIVGITAFENINISSVNAIQVDNIIEYDNVNSDEFTDNTLVTKSYVDEAIENIDSDIDLSNHYQSSINLNSTSGNTQINAFSGNQLNLNAYALTDPETSELIQKGKIQTHGYNSDIELTSYNASTIIQSYGDDITVQATGGQLNLKADSEITQYSNTHITITAPELNFDAWTNLNIQANSDITIQTNEKVNINAPVKYTQDVSALYDDDTLVTKKYVDEAISNLNSSSSEVNIDNYYTTNSINISSADTMNLSSETINLIAANVNLGNTRIHGTNRIYYENNSTSFLDNELPSAKFVNDKVTDLKSELTNYVNSYITGLDTKESVKLATTQNLTGYVAGEIIFSGTLTADLLDSSATSFSVINNDRILVLNQFNLTENGIYIVDLDNDKLIRASDHNSTGEVKAGNYVFVNQGYYKNIGFVLQGNGELTLDVDDINFVPFNSTQKLNAGYGIAIIDNNINIDSNQVPSKLEVVTNCVDAESTGFECSTSGQYLGFFDFSQLAKSAADVYINGVKLNKSLYYFDTIGNYFPVLNSMLFINEELLGYTIESDDLIEIKYLK